MLKFLVLSDTHLVPQGQFSHSINTFERLEQAFALVTKQHPDAAFLVLNGDLADHGESAAYERLRDALESLEIPYYFTLGNHDNAASFQAVFGTEKSVFDHVIEMENQRIIVLNSQHEGKVSGLLDAQQITFLKQALHDTKGHPTILVLHHPISKLGIGTDFIKLANTNDILGALQAHGDIRQVISGHVHITTSGVIGGIPFCTMGGNHYSFDAFSSPDIGDMTRREGPGQMAVVLSDDETTVVHFENFWDKNAAMSPDLFVWEG